VPAPSGDQEIIHHGHPVARFVGPLYQSGQRGDPRPESLTGMVAALAEAAGAPTASATTTDVNAARRLLRTMRGMLSPGTLAAACPEGQSYLPRASAL
jgi:hypothetical protein